MSSSKHHIFIEPNMLSNVPDVEPSQDQSSFFIHSFDCLPNISADVGSLLWAPFAQPTRQTSTCASSDSVPESLHGGLNPMKMTHGAGDGSRVFQSLLTIAMGEHYVSEPLNVGIFNDHPNTMNDITPNECLSTTAFLAPTLQVAMKELQESIMLQLAVRVTALSLRIMAELLPGQGPVDSSAGLHEHRSQLSETVRRALDQAVPPYQWQGLRTYCGRTQYVAALLREAIQVLTVPAELLVEALGMDVMASRTVIHILQTIDELDENPEDVLGAWAASLFLSISRPGETNTQSLIDPHPAQQAQDLGGDATWEKFPGLQSPFFPMGTENMAEERHTCTSRGCHTPNPSESEDCFSPSDSHDERVSFPSTLGSMGQDLNISKERTSKATYTTTTPGRKADLDRDNELDSCHQCRAPSAGPRVSRRSHRSTALRRVDYGPSHPVDDHISIHIGQKRRRQSTSRTRDGFLLPAKRRKIEKSKMLD